MELWTPYYDSTKETIKAITTWYDISSTTAATTTAADWMPDDGAATWTTRAAWTVYDHTDWVSGKSSPRERLRRILRGRHSPFVHTSRRGLDVSKDSKEGRARETLRRIIGDDKYRRFLKHGFVSVKGKSGLTYQIFPGHGMTNVYDRGKKVERLCVVLSGGFPPTDSVIMRYLLILNDERDFRKQAIQHSVSQTAGYRDVRAPADLVEEWKRLKVAA